MYLEACDSPQSARRQTAAPPSDCWFSTLNHKVRLGVHQLKAWANTLIDCHILTETLPSNVQNFLSDRQLTTEPHIYTLNYDSFTAEQVLKALLPENLPEGTPTAFTGTGHLGALAILGRQHGSEQILTCSDRQLT